MTLLWVMGCANFGRAAPHEFARGRLLRSNSIAAQNRPGARAHKAFCSGGLDLIRKSAKLSERPLPQSPLINKRSARRHSPASSVLRLSGAVRVDAELFKAAAKRVWMHAGDLRRAPSAVDASARMREHLFEVGPLHGVEIRHLFGL